MHRYYLIRRICCLVLILAMAPCVTAWAEVTYSPDASEVMEDPNVVIRSTSDADDANAQTLLENATTAGTAAWKNASAYYVVYPDASFAPAAPTESITYNGVTVTATVVVGNSFGTTPLQNLPANDTTIFIRGGTYTDFLKHSSGAWILQHNNLSLIGLGADVVIKTKKRSGLNESIGTGGAQNLLIENITFDGDNVGMPTNSNSSGLYFIKIMQNAVNVVFNNVTVQNVKNTRSLFSGLTEADGVAINMIGAKSVLFNNVTLRNITSKSGFAPIQVGNASQDIYFNNLSLDSVLAGNSSAGGSNYPFIKIEDGSSGTQSNVTVYFTGNLTYANMAEQYKRIWIENYKYDTVAFPPEVYRYASLRNENGAWTRNYIGLSTALPDSLNSYAIFDLLDNTLVVKKGDTFTEEQQIQNIIDTIAFIRKIKGSTDAEKYNIKYEVGLTLGSITLPEITVSSNFSSSYAGYFENIHFNVIPVSNLDNSIETREVFEYLPDTSSISLPAVNNRYTVFNIDFDAQANYSLHEVLDGITTPLASEADPYVTLYGTADGLTYPEYGFSKSEVVPNASIDTFQSCIFTALVREIKLENLTATGSHQAAVGDAIQLGVSLTDANTNSYTQASLVNETLNKDTSNDSVPLVRWYSSDPAVATVDANGLVHAVGVGSVEIIAKAVDEYNDGEIEKPWACYTLEMKAAPVTPSPAPTPSVNGLPQTGDDSNVIAWRWVLLLAAASLLLWTCRGWAARKRDHS